MINYTQDSGRLVARCILGLLACLALGAAMAAHGDAQEMLSVLSPEERAWVAQHPTLRVALYPLPPYQFEKNGQCTGYQVDLMRRICEKAGLEPVFSIHPVGEAMEQIKTGKADAAILLLSNEDRKTFLEFSLQTSEQRMAIFTERDAPPLRNVNDLRGKVIASYSGYGLEPALRRLLPECTFVLAKDVQGMFRLVAGGEADAAVQELFTGKHILREFFINNVVNSGTFKSADTPVWFAHEFAVRKELPVLKSILEKSWDLLKIPEKQELWNFWFGHSIMTQQAEDGGLPRFLFFASLLAAGCLLGSLLLLFLLDRLLGGGNKARRNGLILLVCGVILTAFSASMILFNLNQREEQLRRETLLSLTSTLTRTNEMVRLWFGMESEHMKNYTGNPQVRQLVEALLQLPRDYEAVRTNEAQQQLRTFFETQGHQYGDMTYRIVAPDLFPIAAATDESLAEDSLIKQLGEPIGRALTGQVVLAPAVHAVEEAVTGTQALPSKKVYTHIVCPIRNTAGIVIAVLTMRRGPGNRINELCHLPMSAATKEVYAVNAAGLFLSENKFKDILLNAGVLQEEQSMLALRVADPGVSLLQGERPEGSPQQWPLTHAARQLSERLSGSNMEGYRDYRGVEVLGAWTWDPALEMGFICEVDEQEALASFRANRSVMLFTLALTATLLLILVLLGIRQSALLSRRIREARDEWEMIAQKTSQELRIREEKFYGIFAQSSHFMAVLDPEGRMAECNDSALNFAGVRLEEVVGKHFWDTPWWAHSEPLRQQVREAVGRAAGGAVIRLEAELRHYAGNSHVIDVTIAPVRRGDQVEFVLAIGQDITEITKAQKNLAESEERSRLLLDSVGEGIFGADMDGTITFINPSALSMLGYTQEEILNQKAHSLFHRHDESDLERCPSHRARILGVRQETDDEVFWRQDGTPFFVHITAVPMFRQGQPVGAVTTFTDITERKSKDQELRKLSRAIETSPVTVVITDVKGTIEYVNSSFTDITGYTAKEAVGKNPRILNAGLMPPSYYKDLWETILSGHRWVGEFCNKKKNGDLYWERASIAPVLDEDNHIVNFVAVKEDITEWRSSVERFRILFESSSDAHIIMNTEHILDCNEAAVKILQAKNKGDLLFHHPAEFSPEFQPDGQSSLEKGRVMVETAFQEGYHCFDWMHRKADGEVFPVEVTLTPIQFASQKMLLVVWHDLTERQKTQAVLRESEERFRVLFEHSTDGILVRDGEGILDCNDAAVRLLGAASRKELLGRHPLEFSPPFQPDGTRSLDKVAEMRAQGAEDRPYTFDWLHRRLDGKDILLEVSMTPIRLNDRRLNLVIWHDLTERSRMMEELARARDDAEAANRAKSSFLATMSHEIRTPMNGVIGTVDVLRQTRLTSEQEELAGIIHASAQGLLSIINDILDFSKIESGKMELDLVPLSLEDLVESACSALSPVAQEKGVALECFCDPRLPGLVSSDPVRLRQIINNLLGNAIKFSAGQMRQARVGLQVLQDDPSQVCFVVSDNGIGMDPDVTASLFKPFTQADGSITRRFGGTGLGLSICKNLAEMLGGSISVQSVPGEGSVFTVALPFASVREDQEAAPALPLEGVEGVVLSPHAETAAHWAAYLAHAGAAMAVVSTIEEAVHVAERQTAALGVVVVDCTHGLPEPGPIPDTFPQCKDKIRYVLVRTAGRRSVRHEETAVLALCGDIVRRASLVHAVEVAAGLATAEVEEEWQADGQELTPPSIEEARAEGRLILVAEDNEINQKVIRYQLGIMGFACEIAGNGQEALEMWRRENYALLISDLHMPVMDGYSLSLAIRAEEKDGAHIPIIAFTASISKDELGRCTAAGMNGYLTKPAPMDMFKALLNKWMTEGEPPKATRAPSESKVPETESAVVMPPVYDPSAIKNLTGPNPDLIEEFLADYIDISKKDAEGIRGAFDLGDWNAVGALAHRLKSSSRSVGAMQLGHWCERLELAAKKGQVNEINTLMPEFFRCFEETLGAINAGRRP